MPIAGKVGTIPADRALDEALAAIVTVSVVGVNEPQRRCVELRPIKLNGQRQRAHAIVMQSFGRAVPHPGSRVLLLERLKL